MSNGVLEVSATFHGGYHATVDARGHRIEVDEPPYAGGRDAGAMPTELLCAAVASCFALAIGHVAKRQEIELRGLRVDVRAERAERGLRYDRILVTSIADMPEAELAALVERAERYCWVSNTLKNPPTFEYRSISEDGSARLEVS